MRTVLSLVLVAACGSSPHGGDIDAPTSDPDGHTNPDGTTGSARTIFVIPLENKPSSKIYGNTTYAPYINGLLAHAAWTGKFTDELPSLDSEPHYIWMEAGTNALPDYTFSTDNPPSTTNSSSSTEHLVTQLDAAHVPWRSYQQGIAASTCPTASSGVYAPKHDPFVFFRDVSGTPPSKTNANCIAHHRPYTDLVADLPTLSGYVFITPDLCHDMHGDSSCVPQGTDTNGNIKAGDDWLAAELPRLIEFTTTHDALIFLTWDEGDATNLIPFVMLGAHVKVGQDTTTAYSHSSMLKSVEEYLGVPVLASVASANDFAPMLDPGTL